jgi:hypothetical protein
LNHCSLLLLLRLLLLLLRLLLHDTYQARKGQAV